ncbi:hypothetical protein BH20CHL7_BH20CHL7_19590 [soil metagenome]
MDSTLSNRFAHNRDCRGELQREREQAGDMGSPAPPGRDDEIAALVTAPRVERTVGDAAARRPTAYDADDLEIPSFLRRK